MYGKLNSEHIARIVSITDESRVTVGKAISNDYFHDELGGISSAPDVVVKVLSTQEISEIMKLASADRIPVVVRGSGTGLVGSSVATRGGIMLDTTAMNKILELDEDNLTIRVQPGVLLMELTQYVEERGFFYPPDPGEKSATIGGNISTNAGGMRAVKYGVTRDYVRGLTLVLPSGEVIEVGGKTVKNSSGYSLKDLVVGSEGTLAIVAEATLKLLPLPTHSISVLVPFDDMESAISAVPEIIKAKSIPTAIEYMSGETVKFAEDFLGKKFPNNNYCAYLLLTFDGNSKNAVIEEYEAVANLCLDLGALDVYLIDTDERKSSVWTARGAFLEAIKASTDEMDECDVVVPRSRVADFIIYTNEIAKEIRIRISGFGHAGDGNLHLYICRDGKDEAKWQDRLNKVFDLLYKKAAEYGGLVSGEHGIGYAKKGYMKDQYGDTTVSIMKGIKSVFDPDNILNPDKICQ